MTNQQVSDASEVLKMIVNNEIELAITRIESFPSNEKEDVEGKFILYMLCLMELTLLDTNNLPFRNAAIERLLNQLDSKIPRDPLLLNWYYFFPSNLVFLIACECATLGLDYMIIYKRASYNNRNIDKQWLEREAPFNDIQFEVLKKIVGVEFVIFHLVKQKKYDEAIELAFGMKDIIILNSILNELAKHGKIETVLECINRLTKKRNKNIALYSISNELAKLGMFKESIEYARLIINEQDNSETFQSFSNKFAKQKKIIEVNEIQNDFWKNKALQYIASQEAKQGKIIDALEYTLSIKDAFYMSKALQDISYELINQDKFDEAIKIAQKINIRLLKTTIQMSISSAMSEKGMKEGAEVLFQEALDAILMMIEELDSLQHPELKLDESFENNERKEERIAHLKEFLYEEYDEKPISEPVKESLHSMISEIVKQGTFREALKLIYKIGDVWDKIIALLHLSTQLVKHNRIKEADDLIDKIIDRFLISQLSDDDEYNEQHIAKKLLTITLIEQERLSEAAYQMQETFDLCVTGDRDYNDTFECFNEFLVALEKIGKIEIAAEWANFIDIDFLKNKHLFEISIKLATQGKNDKALTVVQGINDENVKINALVGISTEFFKRDSVNEAEAMMQKAIDLFQTLQDTYWRKRDALKTLSFGLCSQWKWLDAKKILLESIISTKDISIEKDANKTL